MSVQPRTATGGTLFPMNFVSFNGKVFKTA